MRVIVFLFLARSLSLAATGSIHGIVHDPQHRPIGSAEVVLENTDLHLNRTVQSDSRGDFRFDDLPEGVYHVTASAEGFRALQQNLTVTTTGRAPIVHLQLEIARINESIEVSGASSKLETQTSTVQTLVDPKTSPRPPARIRPTAWP